MFATVLEIAAASLKAGTMTVMWGLAFALLFTVVPFFLVSLEALREDVYLHQLSRGGLSLQREEHPGAPQCL